MSLAKECVLCLLLSLKVIVIHAMIYTDHVSTPNDGSFTLYADDKIQSIDNKTSLHFETNGDFVLYYDGLETLWSTNTTPAAMNGTITLNWNSNLVMTNSEGTSIWSTQTTDKSTPPCHLVVGNRCMYLLDTNMMRYWYRGDGCNNSTYPTFAPPTASPTLEPTIEPTGNPTMIPTKAPTNDPTVDPTRDPTRDPTLDPTMDPTMDPTRDPTSEPTPEPTIEPTINPTLFPSVSPTQYPTIMTTNDDDDDDDEDTLWVHSIVDAIMGNRLYQIAGIAVAAVLLLCLCCVCFFCMTKRKSAKLKREPTFLSTQASMIEILNDNEKVITYVDESEEEDDSDQKPKKKTRKKSRGKHSATKTKNNGDASEAEALRDNTSDNKAKIRRVDTVAVDAFDI